MNKNDFKVDDLSSLDPIVSYDWESEYELFFGSDSSNFISYIKMTINTYISLPTISIKSSITIWMTS